jgi:hypothetical protein
MTKKHIQKYTKEDIKEIDNCYESLKSSELGTIFADLVLLQMSALLEGNKITTHQKHSMINYWGNSVENLDNLLQELKKMNMPSKDIPIH